MYSLDFEEFLWGNGVSKQAIGYLKEYFDKKEEIPKAMHEKMMNYFREYIVVGGMPRVVSEFVESHNFANVLKTQRDIVDNYLDDIAKYAEKSEKAKARECFLSIPKQLAKDYKKFQYSLVEAKGTSRKFAGSLMWLYDAGIVNYCYNLTIPELPLEGNSINNQFKIYIYDGLATAIEVKSAENSKAKSLVNVINNWNVKKGIKLSSKNISESKNIINYPLYMAIFL